MNGTLLVLCAALGIAAFTLAAAPRQPPENVAQYLDRSDRERNKQIEIATKELEDLNRDTRLNEKELRKDKKWVERTNRIGTMSRSLAGLKATTTPYQFELPLSPSKGDIGALPTIRVERVINDTEAVVTLRYYYPVDGVKVYGSGATGQAAVRTTTFKQKEVTVWMRDNFKDAADGQAFKAPGLWEVTGTRKVDTDKGQKTVLTVEPIDLSPFVPPPPKVEIEPAEPPPDDPPADVKPKRKPPFLKPVPKPKPKPKP